MFFITSCSALFSLNKEQEEIETPAGSLRKAFAKFDEDEAIIYLAVANVVIETTGLPNHTTSYWNESHLLYSAPIVTSKSQMTSTRIDTSGRDTSAPLIVSANSSIASSTTDTQLVAVGIVVSGAYLYNNYEGRGNLDAATRSLDYIGAHIGLTNHHYHLEPLAFSDDDDELNGIISDGSFIYGRKCNSRDLDTSDGHLSTTQHRTIAEYHYHAMNELYSNTGRYIVFARPYQGTPNEIN